MAKKTNRTEYTPAARLAALVGAQAEEPKGVAHVGRVLGGAIGLGAGARDPLSGGGG